MTTRHTSDSVTFSLAELSKIEHERVRDEEVQRARAREDRAREERQAETRRRAEEETRIAADADARVRRERDEAEERARVEARKQAAIEVARIDAEARTRLEADQAARAHELAVLEHRSSRRGHRLQLALALVVGLVAGGGSAGAYAVTRAGSLETEARGLRDAQASLTREREQAFAADLGALDRRHAALRARSTASADDARAAATAARNAIDERAPKADQLRAFGDALDVLDKRLDGLQQIAELDRRYADLAAWASKQQRSGIMGAAQAAAASAKAAGGDGALLAYEGELDSARATLASGGSAVKHREAEVASPGPVCTLPGDPMCDLKGHSLLKP